MLTSQYLIVNRTAFKPKSFTQPRGYIHSAATAVFSMCQPCWAVFVTRGIRLELVHFPKGANYTAFAMNALLKLD